MNTKTGTFNTHFTYTDQEKDNETGLMYYGARYYDSGVGRFLAIDPWEGNITDPQSLNKYAYTLNNPLKYVDPSGERTFLFTGFQGGGLSRDDTDMQSLISAINAEAQRRGINKPTSAVYQHFEQGQAIRDFLTDEAIGRAEPTIIIGHSYGGDSSIEFARKLNRAGYPVDLLVQIDSIGTFDTRVPDNVETAVNFFQKDAGLKGSSYVRGSYNIQIHNTTHTTIDSNPYVQNYIANATANSYQGRNLISSISTRLNTIQKAVNGISKSINKLIGSND